jgi:hypothetical protein
MRVDTPPDDVKYRASERTEADGRNQPLEVEPK